MSSGGHRTLPNGVWVLVAAVCVFVCVSTYVSTMHTWMHICIVLDLIYADVLYDCVCVCMFDSERLRATASMFIAGKLPQALSLFHMLFSDTHSDDVILFQ